MPRAARLAPAVAAFTMIEIMVVCAIIGIVMTMAIPTIYRQLHPESMQKAVTDVMEACSHARAHAILNGVTTELVIRPHDRQIQVMSRGRAAAEADSLAGSGVSGEEWRMAETSPPSSTSGAFSARLSDRIRIEMLDVNFFEYKEEEEARVRFYPNGTSDEFTIVLAGGNNEWRKITLEVVTALADVETDPSKWMR